MFIAMWFLFIHVQVKMVECWVCYVSNLLLPLQSGRTSSGKSSRSRKASAKSVRSQVSDNETPQDKEGEAKEGDQDGNKLSE